MNKHIVLSLSGGMDSSSLLVHKLSEGCHVTALGFDYGQKHKVELERATLLVQYLQHFSLPVTFKIIKLDGLVDLLDSALVTGGNDVPEGHYEQDNMKATVVPNRNKMFSSIIQSVALSIAQREHCSVGISMGIHAGDHAIYPDCRQEFRDADFEAFKLGNWGSDKVYMDTPYLDVNKYDILVDAQESCERLSIDFNDVFKLTNTSYKPLLINGSWYSDYKSASSVERIEAFIKLGRPDPVEYADDSGPVTWDVAKAHVETVLATQG